ncbi:hypothetical protein GQ55_8G075100 [Panicum hallii var. hallii]|uniref:Auxin efflux carrier component n=1 Tax=Panicum hallii var. hallii TaxID=1504633 RepID=A0A2T7CLX4_9POAL|nr:hypothetical protein GQ55_8G075100 [Panicum hallii var. hallii]
MIPGSAVYHVVEAMAPLYTAAVLGYASVRWLRAFSDEQCAGINHFVALYAIPALIFRMVATSDPYGMNGRLIAAATLQKAVILLSLCAWALLVSRYRRRRRHGGDGGGKASDLASPMKWVVTNFSAPTMSSTIIIGVPLLDGMYGTASGSLVAQLVLMQVCIWYNIIIFLYEYMAALDGGSAKISPEPLALVENCTRDNEGSNINDGVAERSEIIMEVVVAPSTARDSPVAAEATTPAREVMMSSAGAAMTAEVLGVSPSVSKYVIWTAGKKLLKIPNTYASFLGLAWSLIASKSGIKMPKIVDDSLLTISTAALGLSMFASGTFIARQKRFVPCGYGMAAISMALKFLVGPVVVLLTSVAIGLHGILLRIAVVQAALPLAVNSFVYAEEYKVHADVMSTGVILGTFI